MEWAVNLVGSILNLSPMRTTHILINTSQAQILLVIKVLNIQGLSGIISEVKLLTHCPSINGSSCFSSLTPSNHHFFLNIQPGSFDLLILEAKKLVYFGILFLSFTLFVCPELFPSIWKDLAPLPLSAKSSWKPHLWLLKGYPCVWTQDCLLVKLQFKGDALTTSLTSFSQQCNSLFV